MILMNAPICGAQLVIMFLMTDNEIDYPHYFLFAQHQWC